MVQFILKKDWKLLWPMIAALTAIQIGLEWSIFSSGFFRDSPTAAELLRPLSLAWFLGICALTVMTVHEDPIPGVDQDWLIRPLSRTDLWVAKLTFVFLVVGAPMFVLNMSQALALKFPFTASLEVSLYKEIYLLLCLIVPVAALGTITRNMTELVLLGAAMVVVYAVSLCVSAILFGDDSCPTCDSGVSWMQHLLQHLGLLIGAGAIIALQYYRRNTQLSRAITILGVAALVFVQIPWSIAFGIQERLGGASGISAARSIRIDPQSPVFIDPNGNSVSQPGGARQATQALLNGNVDKAAQLLRRRTHRDDTSIMIDLPLQITGMKADETILLDRSDVRLFGNYGELLYHNARADEISTSASNDADDAGAQEKPELIHQFIDVPRAAYRQTALRTGRFRIEYSLTLAGSVAQFKLAAIDGELRTPEIGLCETKSDANDVSVRCKKIGQAPFCYSAVLYAANGAHNSEIRNCAADYRPFFPSLTDVLTFYGIGVPFHDPHDAIHYSVGTADLRQAYVLLKIYGDRSHLKRIVTVAAP